MTFETDSKGSGPVSPADGSLEKGVAADGAGARLLVAVTQK